MPRKALVFLVPCILVAVAACGPSPDAVKKTLREHPEIILDVLAENKVELVELVQQGLQERQALQEEQRLQTELDDPLEPVVEEDRVVFGNPDGDVTIVEYSDFLCPHCSRADNTVSGLVEGDENLRMVFKHFPVHTESLQAALVFEALADEDRDKAWAFKKKLFAGQDAFESEGLEALKRLVSEVGADPALVDKAVGDEALVDRVLADVREAESFGFTGTPMFLVGGVSIRGAAPTGEFERVIRLVRERDAEECPECAKPVRQ